MRPAVEWQPKPDCGFVIGRQKQAIAPEIIEREPIAADRAKQRPECRFAKNLARQQVMSLQAWVITGTITPVHGVERNPLTIGGDHAWTAAKQVAHPDRTSLTSASKS